MEYKSENKICQNCKTQFTIEPEDFKFYEKIKVPPPTEFETPYSPDRPETVYCKKCYQQEVY